MSATGFLVRDVEDITECPICANVLRDPKLLPCFHTFCLQCILQYGENKVEGDAMPCPICGEEFNVPNGGLQMMSTNYFLEKLIGARSALINGVLHCQVSDCEVSHCEVSGCEASDMSGKQGSIPAASICMDWQEVETTDILPCTQVQPEVSMTQQLSQLGNVPTETTSNQMKTNCDKRPTDTIEDCEDQSYPECVIVENQEYDNDEMEEKAEESRKLLKEHADDVTKIITCLHRQSVKARMRLNNLTENIKVTDEKIIKRGEAIKHMIDRDTQALRDKLKSRGFEFVRYIEKLEIEIQNNIEMNRQFVDYCQSVLRMTQPMAITRIANELESLAEELKIMPIPKLNKRQDVNFSPSDLNGSKHRENIVGKIFVRLPMKGHVRGMASSDKELFIVFQLTPDIHVYDAGSFAHKRKITVNGLINPFDIACHANALYVSEREDEIIHRIQLPECTASWRMVNSKYLTMSITMKGNILVSCRSLQEIIEYMPTGQFVRGIKVNTVDENVIGLLHAVQLDEDQFLISYSSIAQHRVGLIDSTGRLIKSYGGAPGRGIGQLNFPMRLAIDQNGFILVVDTKNNRILQLNASLEFIQEIISASAGLKDPLGMHLDKQSGHLYISELNKPNIVIFHL